ncbi:anhydro-N-acetylmuramic acid kinase AnmK [Lederbergia sp. NSJ-179]|uniref:anhydro-N-acetylmuramic acid kinase AnmK n=1 Tax=Lederbergia sp. NSJ-179 TaxID=2931402 RepID=UPI001FD065BE|nr:anhydro-N-acetylmuramic acid kinase AnmK [Lederbergia sp. NSJ-179]MCJ7841527.1 anhydro-N-acetylmuramic acid kinase AnmK [Lederbergia sp. NSJ-179]
MTRLGVGLMSGTSVDGIDAALVQIKGCGIDSKVELLGFLTMPFAEEVRQEIFQCLDPERSNVALVCHLNFKLGYVMAEAVKEVCKQADVPLTEIDFVASHGQTVYHLPHKDGAYERSTLQIGEPAIIAYETGTTVISNFRSMDMAAGGEGAPLVPYADYVLYRNDHKGVALQNIGGIGNLTAIPKQATLDDVIAFDTGPGNMVIDELCRLLKGKPFDDGGKWAASGQVDYSLIESWMKMDYFRKEPPKSTGREQFGRQFAMKVMQDAHHLPAEDMIVTATYFTAASIADAYHHFIFPRFAIEEMIIAGGGSMNKTLLQYIQSLLPTIAVKTQEDLGFSSEAKEAVSFAILGNETLNHRPANVPKATGASEPVILGSITWGQNRF